MVLRPKPLRATVRVRTGGLVTLDFATLVRPSLETDPILVFVAVV